MTQSGVEWSSAPTLAAVLDVERLDRDLFRGVNAETARDRPALYGGQVAAQALRAAGLTVAPDRLPHSFHGYFLRRGRPDLPVLLDVDRDRDGGSFSARHVSAVQEGEVIFSMLASFHVQKESGTLDEVPTRAGAALDAAGAAYREQLLEVCEVTHSRVDDGRPAFPDALWVRVADPLPDDRLVRACAVAYVSDLGSGFGQVEDPAIPPGGPSIDHAVWFETDIAPDDWMLLDLRPAKAGGARGVYLGSVRDRAGRLGAVLAQEMLLRSPDPAQIDQMAKVFRVRRGASR